MKKKQSESDLISQYARNYIEESVKEEKNLQKQFDELIKELKEYDSKRLSEFKKNNPYAVQISELQKKAEALNTSLGDYKDAKEKQLEVDKWYSTEYEKLRKKKSDMSEEDFNTASMGLTNMYESRMIEAESEVWESRGKKMGEIFSDDLSKILLQYESFEGGMKNITKRLYAYIIQESTNALLQQLFGIRAMENMKNSLLSSNSASGNWGIGASLIKGIFKGIGVHHSGGIVPVGANAQLPGTEEQLALLKGGERILSPSENTEYNNNSQGGSSAVVFNNFNIKAWDSKDVQQYLLENKQLLNSITYEGIKNNNSQLRQIVRNA